MFREMSYVAFNWHNLSLLVTDSYVANTRKVMHLYSVKLKIGPNILCMISKIGHIATYKFF